MHFVAISHDDGVAAAFVVDTCRSFVLQTAEGPLRRKTCTFRLGLCGACSTVVSNSTRFEVSQSLKPTFHSL